MSINKKIISHFGSFAIPKKVYYLSEVPKTRSGKILRRLLRDLFEKKTKLGDLSTIKNKKIIEEIRVKLMKTKFKKDRIYKIISTNTKINIKRINEKTKSDDFDNWDSINHINIILDLEKLVKKVNSSKALELN